MYLPDFGSRPVYEQQSAAYKVVMVQAPLLFPVCPGLAFCISEYETQCKTLPLAITAIHLISTQCIVAEAESVLDIQQVIQVGTAEVSFQSHHPSGALPG